VIFRQIFEEAPDPILLIDESFCFVDCNKAATNMLGATAKEQVLMRHPSYFSPEFQPDGQLSSSKANSIIQKTFETQSMHFEWVHRRIDGIEFSVGVSLCLISVHGKKIQLVHWRNITEQKKAEITLRKLSMAVEQNPAAIMITDSNGAIEYANPKFYQMTEYTAEEVLGKTPRILKSGTLPAEHYKELWDMISAGEEWHGEFHNLSKHGRPFWEKASISPIKNAFGAITHFVGVKEDITERKLLQEQLSRMAHFDNLTGLPNRALFFDRMRQTIGLAAREKRLCGILFIDLDGFKSVNDTHGHETGDQLLCIVADRIKASLRASDTAARMGGDEFTVILATLKKHRDVDHVAKKVLSKLCQPIIIGPAVIRIGASIGSSIFPDDAEDVEMLVHNADKAMYEVKRSGKNRHKAFSAEASDFCSSASKSVNL
jgi:diguanylate cyclase (GGDEF)-like protein/PAS domain S-box-containing protein